MCVQTTLASSGAFQIERCSQCGGLSLHLGPMTIRMDLKAIRSLHGLLHRALQQVEKEAERERPVLPRVGSLVN